MKILSKQDRVLIVDDEEKIRIILGMILRDAGYTIETAKDGNEAVEKSGSFKPQVLIVDLQMPRMDGIETVMKIKERLPQAVSVILTAHGTIQSAVQAIKQGIYDYITKPFDNEQILLVVKRALEVHRLTEEVDELKKELHKTYGINNIIGESDILKKTKQQILQIAHTDATVLIEGESGTGKELAARAIHFESERKNDPFVVIDCTAIPTRLIESEFFGHEKGAYTDARERRPGKFEEADGGTVFLDEIGELPAEAQAKLLRVLQEKEFSRVGATTTVKVDVRVIAATNKSLERLLSEGRFREDLYYRLNVLKLRMPPLREHREDIPPCIEHFLQKHRTTFGKNVGNISPEVLTVLKNRDWKGNIRELENTIQRALLNASTSIIEMADVEFLTSGTASVLPEFDPGQGLEAFIKSLTERSERELIIRTLEETNWNRTEAAGILKISRKTLFNKIRQYRLPEKG